MRSGLGWTIPIVDADVRRRAMELADRFDAPSGFGPFGFVDAPPSATRTVRCKASIDAAMGSLLLHASVTDEEIDGVLSGAAMVSSGATSPVPAWLDRRGGITDASKRLAAVVLELQPCREAALWERVGGCLGEREWSRFLVEAIEVGIVQRTSDGRLVTPRVIA